MKRDAELRFGILEELKYQPAVYSTEIGVCVKDQVVTLTGHVPSLAKKKVAEEIVKRIYGVKAVANEIQVDLPGVDHPNDSTIARSAVERIESDSSLPKEGIVVVVEDGWVTLEGQVDWAHQMESLVKHIENVKGVKGVINLIFVKNGHSSLNYLNCLN